MTSVSAYNTPQRDYPINIVTGSDRAGFNHKRKLTAIKKAYKDTPPATNKLPRQLLRRLSRKNAMAAAKIEANETRLAFLKSRRGARKAATKLAA